MTLRDALFKLCLAGETLEEVIERLSERCCRCTLSRPRPEFPEMKVTEVFSHEERRWKITRTPPFPGGTPEDDIEDLLGAL